MSYSVLAITVIFAAKLTNCFSFLCCRAGDFRKHGYSLSTITKQHLNTQNEQ